jgi:membrane associated rhomboid family serine protease
VRLRRRLPSSAGPLIGASGAIAGVLGAYLVLYAAAAGMSLRDALLGVPELRGRME